MDEKDNGCCTPEALKEELAKFIASDWCEATIALTGGFYRVWANLSSQMGLSVTQSACLYATSVRGPMTMGEIADWVVASGAGATQMVDTLVAKGLAERVRDEEDRRIVRVAITPEGGKLVGEFRSRYRKIVQRALEMIPDDQLDAVLSSVSTLAAAILLVDPAESVDD